MYGFSILATSSGPDRLRYECNVITLGVQSWCLSFLSPIRTAAIHTLVASSNIGCFRSPVLKLTNKLTLFMKLRQVRALPLYQ